MGVAPSRASAYWSPVSVGGTEVQGWFTRTGEYTGRWMSNTTWSTYVRTIAAGSEKAGVGTPGTGFTSTELNVGKSAYDALRTTSTAAATVTAVQNAKGVQLGLMSTLKSWGTLKTLGTIGLAATSFEVGYKIGGVVADLIWPAQGGESEPAATAVYKASGLKVVEAGGTLCEGVFIDEPKPCLVTAPVAEQVVSWQWVAHETSTFEYYEANGEGCGTRKYFALPAGSLAVHLGQVWQCGGLTEKKFAQVGVLTVPLSVSHLPGDAGGSPKTTVEGSAQTPKTATAAIPDVEGCLRVARCDGLAGHYAHHIPEVESGLHVEPGYPLDATIPDPAKITVPAPAAGETYTAYVARLTELGLIGQAQELSETAIDTTKGPLEVTSTTPVAGTQLAPDSPVKVRYNPADAPEAGGGPAPSSCEANVDAVDLAPLSVPAGDKFPFGIFVFFVDWVSTWSTTVVAPVFDLPLAGSLELHVDLAVMEPLMGPVRVAIIFASFVGLLWFLGTAALKLQGDNS
jgi:hypothetical protein